MIDFAKITVRAGTGGNGCGSFHHIKGKRYGKASGGNGGKGGNVYIEATTDLNTLEPYRFVKDYQAQNGQSGLSNLRRGANSRDLILKVPVGTTVTLNGNEARIVKRQTVTSDYANRQTPDVTSIVTDKRSTTYDLIESNQRLLLASGGQGGRGNAYLRDEFGRRPRTGETGQQGEAYGVTLELKLIADVGLIGLPNAGKSTLLAALTAAQPAIAPYPFTTLEPNLGVLTENRVKRIELRDYPLNSKPYSLILADIPGLIEGASEGKGLGHQFLRHIERTKLLVHLIDSSQFTVHSSQDLWSSYQAIRNELKTYSKELAKKKEIIVLTKIDLVDKEKLAKAKAVFTNHRKKTIAVSAVTGEGLEELKSALFKLLG